MSVLKTRFAGLDFPNPFILASAPPTESEEKIRAAFDAGWGGVVTKTIGMEPAVNVDGPRTVFASAAVGANDIQIGASKHGQNHSSWNWESYSDKPLEWWVPRINKIKQDYPDNVLIVSIMAGSGNEEELENWKTLTKAVQEAGADAIELNLSCPHMARSDMGDNLGKDAGLVSTVVQAVKSVSTVPVIAKLTPNTADIATEAQAVLASGADAVSASNTFTSLPLIDPDRLRFATQVDGKVSMGGLGGPAVLQQGLAKIGQISSNFPDAEISGIGGISSANSAIQYMLLGSGTVQVCTAAMLDKGIGKNLIEEMTSDLEDYINRHREFRCVSDIVGYMRPQLVPNAEIRLRDHGPSAG